MKSSKVCKIGNSLLAALLSTWALFEGAGCVGQTAQVESKFTHGVASGDPDQHSVVLWTRYEASDDSVQLQYEISTHPQFSDPVITGHAVVLERHNYCAKVIAEGLQPGVAYYYRFSVGTDFSPVGRTKTLPSSTDRIKIGVVNCSKYTGGYYHAYDALAEMEDIDVVIHLGDYIYENGPSTPQSSYWQAYQKTGRQHEPLHECLSLADYRTRYAQYRSDSSLQKLHARYPMIAIWDDHEIAMKKHKKNKEGKQVMNEAWESRRDYSIQAYHEWLPLRPEPFEEIYRSFQFGELVNLLMLDTRVCCRSEVPKTEASLRDSSRHIVGNTQLQWIFNEVEKHDAHWNVFGNQILLSEKGNGWNRWQGFPHDRERLLAYIGAHRDKNFVFTTGNAHNPHHYLVFGEDEQDTLLHELLPGSISSGNNAEKARFDPDILQKEAKRLNEAENVLWFDQNAHGFIVLEITREMLEAKWYFVSSIWTKSYETLQPYTTTIHAHSIK